MPPLVSDEESGDEDIPFKPAKATKDDSDSDDGEEDEDEYVIEDIVGHEWDGPTGEVLYQVKWEGWDSPEDLTWEPEANLESAQDALKQYYKKIGGKPAPKEVPPTKGKGGKKRKAADTPKSSAARTKRSKSETPEVSTKKTKKDDTWKLPKGSWEDQVASIDTIEEAFDDKGVMQRFVYVMWENGSKTRHQLATVNQKCPQKMLRYYESHLVFRSAEAANGEGDVS